MDKDTSANLDRNEKKRVNKYFSESKNLIILENGEDRRQIMI